MHSNMSQVWGAHMYKDHGPSNQREGVDSQPGGVPVCHKGADVRQLAHRLYHSCSQRQQFLVQLESRPALQQYGHWFGVCQQYLLSAELKKYPGPQISDPTKNRMFIAIAYNPFNTALTSAVGSGASAVVMIPCMWHSQR